MIFSYLNITIYNFKTKKYVPWSTCAMIATFLISFRYSEEGVELSPILSERKMVDCWREKRKFLCILRRLLKLWLICKSDAIINIINKTIFIEMK